jgi:hypothetical protein
MDTKHNRRGRHLSTTDRFTPSENCKPVVHMLNRMLLSLEIVTKRMTNTDDINVTEHYKSLKDRVVKITGGGQWNVIEGTFQRLEEVNAGVTSKAM